MNTARFIITATACTIVALFVIAVAGGLLVSSCAPLPGSPEASNQSYDLNIQRWIDREAGVVCWLSRTGDISCLDIDDTDLR